MFFLAAKYIPHSFGSVIKQKNLQKQKKVYAFRRFLALKMLTYGGHFQRNELKNNVKFYKKRYLNEFSGCWWKK
jgi:hypothetical protein